MKTQLKKTDTKISEPVSQLQKQTRKWFFNPNFLIGAGLLLLTILFYWPIISLQGTIWNDFIEQYFPYRVFASHTLKHFVFPFWNPYSFAGMPFFADIQSAVLYPLNLILVPFGDSISLSAITFEYQIIFHVFLSGLFTFFLARDFSCSKVSSFGAAIIMMFGGFTTAHLIHVTMIHALPWMVLSILTLKRALSQQSLLYMVLTGATLFMVNIAGHPQMLLYHHYWLGCYLLYHIISKRKAPKIVRTGLISIAIFAGSVSIGGGLSAIQILPTRELSQNSVRPKMEFKESSQGSFRPYRMITLAVPNYYGIPNRLHSESNVYWGITSTDFDPGSHYYWETTMYVGVATLLLILLSLFTRSSIVYFFTTMSLLAFLIAMGDSTFFYRIAYSLLPGFNMFRNPARIGALFSVSSALLAALGMDWVLIKAQLISVKRKKQILFSTAAICGAVLLYALIFSSGSFKDSILNFILENGFFGKDAKGISSYVEQAIYPYTTGQVWIFAVLFTICTVLINMYIWKLLKKSYVSAGLLLILSIDFFIVGYGSTTTETHPDAIYRSSNLIESIHQENQKELFRINSRGTAPGTDLIGGPYMIFRRNEGTVHQLYLTEGYNPLRLNRQILQNRPKSLDILNVKYKIDVNEDTKQIGIVPHSTYFPRAWICPNYKIQTDENKILPEFHDQTFDHRTTALLETEPQLDLTAAPHSTEPKAQITSYSLNKIQIQTTSETNGILMLSEIYYPAWKATIDSKPAKLIRADYALRAIPVPAGKHTVICEYRDNSFTIGLIISLITLLVSIAITAYAIRIKRTYNTGTNSKVLS